MTSNLEKAFFKLTGESLEQLQEHCKKLEDIFSERAFLVQETHEQMEALNRRYEQITETMFEDLLALHPELEDKMKHAMLNTQFWRDGLIYVSYPMALGKLMDQWADIFSQAPASGKDGDEIKPTKH